MFPAIGLEEEIMDLDMEIKISPSLMGEILPELGGCPFFYNLVYNLQVEHETPFWLKMVLNRGSVFHQAYDHFFDVLKWDEMVNNFKQDKLKLYFENVFYQLIKLSLQQTYVKEAFANKLFDTIPLVSAFEFNRFQGLYQNLSRKGMRYVKESYFPIFKEDRLVYKSTNMVGKIDFFGKTYEYNLGSIKYVRDYKTSFVDLSRMLKYKVQLCFYCILVSLVKDYITLVNYGSLFYGRGGREVWFIFNKADFRYTIDLINKTAKILKKSNYYRPRGCSKDCENYEICKEYFDKDLSDPEDLMVKDVDDVDIDLSKIDVEYEEIDLKESNKDHKK